MTAVEWLLEHDYLKGSTKWPDIVEQALAMEREQIIEAYDSGLFDGSMDDVNDRLFENYYQETYKNSKTPPGEHCEEA